MRIFGLLDYLRSKHSKLVYRFNTVNFLVGDSKVTAHPDVIKQKKPNFACKINVPKGVLVCQVFSFKAINLTQTLSARAHWKLASSNALDKQVCTAQIMLHGFAFCPSQFDINLVCRMA